MFQGVRRCVQQRTIYLREFPRDYLDDGDGGTKRFFLGWGGELSGEEAEEIRFEKGQRIVGSQGVQKLAGEERANQLVETAQHDGRRAGNGLQLAGKRMATESDWREQSARRVK